MIRAIFAVPVNPEPWAIGPVGFTNKGGKPRGFVGQNQQLRNYQDAVRQDLKMQIAVHYSADRFPVSSPVRLHLFFWRRLDAYQIDDKKSSRNWADATNMQKAFEDALQGLLFVNDRNNIQVSSAIVEQGPEVIPGTIVVMEWSNEIKPDMSVLDLNIIAAAKAKFAQADKFIFDNQV